MIDSFVVGQQLQLSKEGRWLERYGLGQGIITVLEVWDESSGMICAENCSTPFRGSLDLEWFDYYGNNVNVEVLDLINRHNIKSFQAILDDGRVIHMSCLN